MAGAIWLSVILIYLITLPIILYSTRQSYNKDSNVELNSLFILNREDLWPTPLDHSNLKRHFMTPSVLHWIKFKNAK